MTGGIEKHTHVLVRLMLGGDRSEGNRFGHGALEIGDLEVEVHHRSLVTRRGWPGRRAVVAGLLEHDERGPTRCSEHRRSRLLVHHGPAEQIGIELRQCP